ncbi:hypothetical protein ACJ41O_003722 [Fusarium nematophilum]
MSSAAEGRPRKRAKHTRSKLGCGVCRIRRVKCDRTRPACERCTKTGRKCDGYSLRESGDPILLVQRSQSPSSSTAALSLLDRSLCFNAHGSRALDYFQAKAAPELCGFFENDLWSRLVLQISRRESCVRQMVVALGLLHESFHPSSHPTSSLLRRCAISEYGQGIMLLNSHISTQGWASLEITLLCSILCVAFEWLRGDYDAAHTHLSSSMNVMSQWTNVKRPRSNGTSPSSPGGHMIRTQLGPLWTSLVLQARTMPSSSSSQWHMPLGIEQSREPFSSLDQARRALDVLIAYLLPETVAKKFRDSTYQYDPWDLALPLSEWSRSFTAFLGTQGPSERASPRVAIMDLWHRTARMFFISSFSTDEADLDGFLPEFIHIVKKVGDLVSCSTSKFSMDIGIVPLLYYVALKCRHPEVRRRAIEMLRATPRREAVWDSIGAAAVVEEVMRVEEEGLGEISSQFDIPAAARVFSMEAVTDVEHRRIWIKTMQQGERRWSEEKVLTW